MSSADGAGTVVPGSVVTSGTLSAGWNYIPLATPIPIAINGTYTAATGTSGPYPDTVNQFGSAETYSAGITNGPLSCFSDTGGSNPSPDTASAQPLSTAGGDPALYQPVLGTGNHDNFWIDVQVTAQAPANYTGSYRLWPNMTDADFGTTSGRGGQLRHRHRDHRLPAVRRQRDLVLHAVRSGVQRTTSGPPARTSGTSAPRPG